MISKTLNLPYGRYLKIDVVTPAPIFAIILAMNVNQEVLWSLAPSEFGLMDSDRNTRILRALLTPNDKWVVNGIDDVIAVADTMNIYILQQHPRLVAARSLSPINVVDLRNIASFEKIMESLTIGYSSTRSYDVSMIKQGAPRLLIAGLDSFLQQGDFSSYGSHGCTIMQLLVIASKYGKGTTAAINESDFMNHPDIKKVYGFARDECHFMKVFFGEMFTPIYTIY